MAKYNVRAPAVAGQFYPGSAQELKNQIKSLLGTQAAQTKKEAIACMMPHAGYIYSGTVAAETASQIKIKERVILVGPNHTGYGPSFSLMSQGIWKTPLGEIEIDAELAKEMLGACKYLKEDSLAHQYEHCLEVEIPILQYLKDSFKIVPLVILSDQIDALKGIGQDIAGVIKKMGIKDSTLLVASSDMTHYEPQREAEKKDKEAIKAILELDENTLAQKISRLGISMCGWAACIIMLTYAKSLGAKSAKLVRYLTSGNVTQDYTSVVGYAGITVS